jgi:hypothetical protein
VSFRQFGQLTIELAELASWRAGELAEPALPR